jgi:uncharacterized protein (TIGR00369 family)
VQEGKWGGGKAESEVWERPVGLASPKSIAEDATPSIYSFLEDPRQPSFTYMQDQFTNAPVSRLIGFDVLPATEDDRTQGKAIVVLEVDERLHNPMGRVHGGILSALADAAMGIAFGRTLDKDQDFSTIDLHIHFMRPVRCNRVTASAELVQRGLRIGFVTCTITDDRSRIIAQASCSCTSIS